MHAMVRVYIHDLCPGLVARHGCEHICRPLRHSAFILWEGGDVRHYWAVATQIMVALLSMWTQAFSGRARSEKGSVQSLFLYLLYDVG